MGESRRLRLRDLRAIYRLIGECRELGADPREWRSHLLSGLCHLVGAQIGANVEATLSADRQVSICGSLSAGWPDPVAESIWRRFVTQEAPEADPLYNPLMSQLPAPGRVVTRARHQLVSDREWYGSRHFHEYRRPSRNDECVYSYYLTAGGSHTTLNCLELYRNLNDRSFSARQRRMIHWLHYELGPLLGRQLTWLWEPAASALAPRLQQTLACLLEGDSEKQIAMRLELSPATVHEYVTAIYRHFDVHSRGELFARWLRFR